MTEEMFGPYRLQGIIGRGGMGEVYRAFDTVRGRVVALKRLPPHLAEDAEFRGRFRREAALAAKLHEPHIVPIHDFGEIDGRLFIDMRLVEGTDLAATLAREGRISPARAVNVVVQVAAALDVAHREGLVHRDIKPGNILVTRGSTGGLEADEFIYVADFGIARSVGSTTFTATGAMIGSIDYMAPERFSSGGGDHRVDVYALGCVLFEALTGRKPFTSDGGIPAMIHAHLSSQPPKPSDYVAGLPVGFDAVIAQAMAKDPNQRFASAGALAAAARNAAAGAVPTGGRRAPVPSTLIGPGPGWAGQPPAPEPRRRSPRVPLVLAGVVVLIAAVAGGAFLLGAGQGSGSAAQPGSSDIRAEPVRSPGDNPFMPAVGTDQVGATPPSGSGGTFTGATVGLYGGTLRTSSCDASAMASFLAANPDKGTAWAEVQGIAPDQIGSYLAGLTPVILRSDTAVTNHGFANGQVTVVPAVLQAGTAVLVDRYGTPRARCSCGNPLLAAAKPAAPQYVGTTWSGFSPAAISTIVPSAAPVSEFTLVDPQTGAVIYRPVGSAGEKDREATPATPTRSALPARPLYQISSTTDAVGPSGSQADPGVTDVPGSTNTSFWAGCEGVPANTRFALGGDYSRSSGRLTLASYTPSDLVILVRLLGDGAQLDSATLRAGQSHSFDVSTSGVQTMTISAQVISGTCTSAPAGYGVAVGAVATP